MQFWPKGTSQLQGWLGQTAVIRPRQVLGIYPVLALGQHAGLGG